MARGHSQQAVLHAKESVSIGFDSDIGAALRKYAADIQEQAIRPAAAAAARVLYEEVRQRTPVYTGPAKKGINPGQLKAAIYHWHDTKRSTKTRQIYAIGPNKAKAPHWFQIEFGNSQSPAHPYVRPAYDSKISTAMAAAKKRLAEKISEIGGKP